MKHIHELYLKHNGEVVCKTCPALDHQQNPWLLRVFLGIAAAALLALFVVPFALAQTSTITALPTGNALGGTEPIAMDQSGCGSGAGTCKTNPAVIATYVQSLATSAQTIALFTGSCNSGTFLRGDGSCAAASFTPSGHVSGLQYNNGGTTISSAYVNYDEGFGGPTYAITGAGGGSQIFTLAGGPHTESSPARINLHEGGGNGFGGPLDLIGGTGSGESSYPGGQVNVTGGTVGIGLGENGGNVVITGGVGDTANGGTNGINVLASPTQLVLYNTSTLPACTSQLNSAIAAVSDATLPTYGGAYTGGGAVQTIVYCISGTGWTTH